MATIDTTRWTKIGRSTNADFYEVEPRILAVVPFEACDDTEETARESVQIQLHYLRAKATRAGVIVFMDRVLDQTAAARDVYRLEPDPAFQACFALVGGTLIGKAVGSVFLGLNPPRVPTRLFAEFGEALDWARRALEGP